MQKLLIYICLILLGTRCAQITPLTGGKKDATAPKALTYKPENATLNFNAKTIEVTFDEYITLKDVSNQFIITPQTKETPEIEAAGKKLKITFNETLLPNTTYKLAFGNAITDLNESNVLQNFEYIFSTGPVIDSMKLSGKVYNAIDLKPSAQVLIGLYDATAIDSVIYKDKPLYITKTDDGGTFKFNYLPHSPFKMVAIKDANKNLLYDGSEEQIAFRKESVTPGDSNNISLSLFKETPFKSFIKKSYSAEYGKAYIIYNKPQEDIREVTAKGLLYYKQNRLKDTVVLYYANKYDTLETFVKYDAKKTDTIYIKLITAGAFDKQLKNKAIKYNLQAGFGSALPFYQLPSFDLNVPADSRKLTEDKLILMEKTDSVSKKIPFKIIKEDNWITSFKVQAEFKPEANYTLTVQKAAITDNSQRMNDSVSYQFKTTAVDDYAQLKMKLLFPKKENYIVILLNDKEQLIEERVIEFSLMSTSEKIIDYKNLIPGNYFIKVVEDANKNGLFDAGDYFLNKQPEIIFVNPSPIKLLAGWEIENEWIVK
ncbi:MAG: Ig-like domain-containing protein [Bacteroidetes bacterium]|nr:Ig-like domain-containing protein [Bacteroidota bacterium]